MPERHPDPPPAAPHLDRALGRLVPMAPATLGAVLALLALAHLTAVPDLPGVMLGVASGTAGLFLLGAALWWRGRPLGSTPAHAVTALCLVLAAADALAHARLTGSLERTGELVLVVAGAGVVLLDDRWLLPTVGALTGAWGAVVLTGAAQHRTYGLTALAVAVVACAGTRRVRAQAVAQLAEVHAAAALAVLDPLTGLVDRRGLQLLGDKLVAIARRESGAVGATFVEVDGLARVRRTLGGPAADDLLVHMADVLQSVTRGTDVVARWSDEQFVLVTHGQGAPMEVLRARLARALENGCPVPASVWPRELLLGRAVLEPWDEGGLASLVSAAERDVHVRSGRRPPERSRRAAEEEALAERRRAQAEAGQATSEVVAAAHEAVSAAAGAARPAEQVVHAGGGEDHGAGSTDDPPEGRGAKWS